MIGEKSKNVALGFVIGMASMLPGISGGIIAVIFGVYERLVEDVADIFRKVKEDFWFLLTLGGGIILGMGIVAFGLDFVLQRYLAPTLCLFVGLIISQLPDVYDMTDRDEKLSVKHVIAFAIGVALMVALLFFDTPSNTEGSFDHTAVNILIMFLCGVVIAISKVVPGVSGTALILAFGMYQVFISSITDMDFILLIPFGIGIVVGGIGCAKVMVVVLKKYHNLAYYAILGLTVGSVAVVLWDINFSGNVFWGGVMLAIGLALGVLFSRIGRRYVS